MIRSALGAGLLAALVPTGPAGSVEIEDFALMATQDLVDLCDADPASALAPEARQACYGYVAGTIHFYRALVDGGDRFKPVVCPGRELTREEVAGLLVEWAPKHPEHMAELPVEGVMRALVGAYPCPGRSPSN